MNLALLTLPLNLAVIYFVKVPVGIAMAKHGASEGKGYDNRDPRGQQAKLEGWGRRAHAAHQNGFEAFAPFAVGVGLCVALRADPQWTLTLALVHTVARLVYPALYIANIDKLRSLVWFAGASATFALLVLAAAATP
jgi:uncharacterized MAPEG superfamily protein